MGLSQNKAFDDNSHFIEMGGSVWPYDDLNQRGSKNQLGGQQDALLSDKIEYNPLLEDSDGPLREIVDHNFSHRHRSMTFCLPSSTQFDFLDQMIAKPDFGFNARGNDHSRRYSLDSTERDPP